MNLRHDLAKLLIKLRKYKAAVRVLRSGLTVMAGSISSACTTTLLSESARFAFCDSDYHDRATSIKGGGFGEKRAKLCGVTTMLLLADVYAEAGFNFDVDAALGSTFTIGGAIGCGGSGGSGGIFGARSEEKLQGSVVIATRDATDEDFDESSGDTLDGKVQLTSCIPKHAQSDPKQREGSTNGDILLDTLFQAKELQASVLAQVQADCTAADGELLTLQRCLADICCRIAAVQAGNFSSGSDNGGIGKERNHQFMDQEKVHSTEVREQALLDLYADALRADAMHEDALLSLAGLNLRRGELNLAEDKCQMARHVDGQRMETAVLLLANIAMAR